MNRTLLEPISTLSGKAAFDAYPPGVDSVVPLPCFARNLLYAAGIIEAALGFLVRPRRPDRSDSDDRVDFHPSNKDLSLGTPIAAEPASAEASPQ